METTYLLFCIMVTAWRSSTRRRTLLRVREEGWAESGTINSVTCRMPIPQDVHKRVDSYKVAYYESDRPIGETRQETAFRIMCQGDGNPIEKGLAVMEERWRIA